MQSNLNIKLFRSDFVYQDLNSLEVSSSLAHLLRTKENWQWDSEFMALYQAGKDTWPRSPVGDIRKIEKNEPGSEFSQLDFSEILRIYFETQKSGMINVALSGGLDSQVIALAAKYYGHHVRAFYLKTDIENYCEASIVRQFCQKQAIELIQIEADSSDFISALPAFLKATECPIYNLHPISKWILARELRKLGIQHLYSGDGADQCFAGLDFCDLFFLTKSCFLHFDIALHTPLANWPLFYWVKANGPFVDKEPLRKWAYSQWKLGNETKKKTFFPDSKLGIDTFQESLVHLKRLLCAH